MSITVDNAVILAAGASSRFAPLSYEKPKGLLTVRGEVLIERQIRQLQEAGIRDIYVVVGYQKEKFAYLREKCGVRLIENPDYHTKNNPSSLWAARDVLNNTYVCSSDNYFTEDPFTPTVEDSYYATVYAPGKTDEWCVSEDEDGTICGVTIGGENAWVMLGHTFWSREFSHRFLELMSPLYAVPEVSGQLWERFYMAHLDVLHMKARHYPPDTIYEFDSLEELRAFDPTYLTASGSPILGELARRLHCGESALTRFSAIYGNDSAAVGCTFRHGEKIYRYHYDEQRLEMLP